MSKIETRKVVVYFAPHYVRSEPDAPDLDALGMTKECDVEVEVPWFCPEPGCGKPYKEPVHHKGGPSTWETTCIHGSRYSQAWIRAWHLKQATTPREEPSGQLTFNWR